jgi:hypothetical protein
MPNKEKQPEFTVTDRRLFSEEGELRQDVVEAEERRYERERAKSEAQERANEERAAQQKQSVEPSSPSPASAPLPGGTESPGQEFEGQAPTAHEQREQAEAYKQSTKEIDERIRKELGKQGQAHRAQEFEITFEKFIASLYMSALMQLGLAAPQGGQPQVDLIGARQTIDTIAILQEKTKGNLTPAEENMLQNVLYELRMAYLEVTNLITNPPEGGMGGKGQA